MTGGFGAVPDELRQTASSIGDVISGVADMVWRGPGGDYGHPGVQQGWTQFIEDMRRTVEKLHAKAGEHGENLKKAAIEYVQSDQDVNKTLARIGDVVGDLGAPVGGGITGGIGGIVPSVSVGTGDGGMVGGGWAGPLHDRGVDLGAGADAHAGSLDDPGDALGTGADPGAGVMSPERSRELFPPGDLDSRLNPDDDERVY